MQRSGCRADSRDRLVWSAYERAGRDLAGRGYGRRARAHRRRPRPRRNDRASARGGGARSEGRGRPRLRVRPSGVVRAATGRARRPHAVAARGGAGRGMAPQSGAAVLAHPAARTRRIGVPADGSRGDRAPNPSQVRLPARWGRQRRHGLASWDAVPAPARRALRDLAVRRAAPAARRRGVSASAPREWVGAPPAAGAERACARRRGDCARDVCLGQRLDAAAARHRRPARRADLASTPAATLGPLTEVAAEQSLHRALGLTDEELDRIRGLLDRNPNDFELAVFSLLWSEHCGYKHSALLLRRLPSQGERVLQGPGENAGVIDLGNGEALAFKVESHNHPSAVEPFQGAATGIGGILRDIVAMGARPIALLDGLRFGYPGWQLARAVAGIGHYGNCVGVPTVGGELVVDEAYAGNCLVNAMCVGLLPSERVTRARAAGPGKLVLLFGATTGRDGIGGASVLASQELGEGADEKRPAVQNGEPFTGKKLIEASVELVERGLVEALQDCGAAGLASALAELAGDGAGIDVHLDRVPLREPDLEPWEIMISESQERMVAVVRREMLEAAERVLDRWELHHATIGEVTPTGELRCLFENEVVGEIPARLLTEEVPRYRIEASPRRGQQPTAVRISLSRQEALLELLRS